MRPISVTMLAAACMVSFAAAAAAGTKLTVHTRTYDVAGKTGAELMEAMDSKGPRHGFTTRAIAETGYTVRWGFDLAREKGVCRIRRADGTIDVTYTFPQLASPVDRPLSRRWGRFMAGVRQHEQTHGRIAMQMMRATEKALTGLELSDNSFCGNVRSEAKRRIDTIYAEYEGRQKAFDAREHRDGGHVDRLVRALIGKN